ncbi:MoaD/ThiS family protein [Solitalea sp. MAHUQ-68]|uniref:Molybdopterin synthase sulfur carrier subunit n=1 Tax=Solitalea agri TaxID=2953739 RepID=A0A9X2F0J3_9SPHI|nr:MoaD/ThiS family protein [Solitalea agri]MCO4292377.1 MoaD/ThiS family protein [Solitalea agri]
MSYTVLLFGVTKDIIGSSVYCPNDEFYTVGHLREHLYQSFPLLQKLNSLMIAVNMNYAEDHIMLSSTDEIALIPPVSGG